MFIKELKYNPFFDGWTAIQDGCTWNLVRMSDEELQQVLSNLEVVGEVDADSRQNITASGTLTENDYRLKVYHGEIDEGLLELMCSVEADYAANAEWTRAATRATKRSSLKQKFWQILSLKWLR